MKKKISTLMSGIILTVSLFSVQPSFALLSESQFTKEYCAISQAEKCKQEGKGCEGKKVCFWKDLGELAGTAGKVAGAAAAVVTIIKATD